MSVIRLSIPKSSWLRLYVKVRRVTKNVSKLHTKRVRLHKVAQHEKKRIKLKYRASRYLSTFSCNRPMCLYKSQTHVSNYCKFQLSSDTEKNPAVLLKCTLTLAKQYRHHVAKLMSWCLDKVQDKNVLQTRNQFC